MSAHTDWPCQKTCVVCWHYASSSAVPPVHHSPVNVCLPAVPHAVPARCRIRTPATRANSADAIPVDPAGTRNAALPGAVVAAVQCTLTGGIPDAVGAGAQLLALAVRAAGASPAVPSCGAALTYAAGSAAAATAAGGSSRAVGEAAEQVQGMSACCAWCTGTFQECCRILLISLL
jgi:hypothetical protein